MTNTRAVATRSVRPAATDWTRPTRTASTTVEHNDRPRHENKITGGWVFPPDLSHELRYTSDRRRATAAGFPGTRRGPDRDHLPGSRRPSGPAVGLRLRRLRADLEPAHAVPVPTAVRHRGPPADPQLHPRMPRCDLASRAAHRRRRTARVATPRLPQNLRDRCDTVGPATAYRGQDLRSPAVGHHHGVRRDLPRRRGLPSSGLHRPPPVRTAERGIPRPQHPGMGRIFGPFRAAEGRPGQLR